MHKQIENIAAGWLRHALPFTTHTELMTLMLVQAWR